MDTLWRVVYWTCILFSVDGVWAKWQFWGACSAECGGGERKRYRECAAPASAHGGNGCPGSVEEGEPCNTHAC